VPLSFDWGGEALLMAGRRTARPAGTWVLEIASLPQERGDRFAAHTGFDPRALATPYRWFRISPRRIQAWREVDEMPDRELMRDGRRLGSCAERDPASVSRTGVAPPRRTPPIR
jgi:hypothetical protein